MKLSHLLPNLALALAVAALPACSKHDHSAAGHQHGKHEHKTPHGGTAVVLGDEAYHLELVRDAATGTLQAYVLDGHMEKFIRINAPAIELAATIKGAPQTLALKPVANPATGETASDTSLFEARAEWLKTTAQFDAVVKSITIRGTTFRDVKFNFPKGNEAH